MATRIGNGGPPSWFNTLRFVLDYDIYRPEATQQQATLWKLESDLDKAIKQRALEVYYQPKVDIHGGQIDTVTVGASEIAQ